MTIQEIYQSLCRLYAVDGAVDIRNYLLPAFPADVGVCAGHSELSREALLIRQSGEELELGLFIAPAILAALEGGEPLRHADELSCAIEGASHFLYVTDRAGRGRRVSMLELELQGEVDKFLLLQLIAAADAPHRSRDLFAQQFERHAFDARLSPERRERYATASHFAAKYCAALRERCFNPLRMSDLLPQVRDFFGRDLSAKLERLIP